jgi:hypothetical protein
MTSGKELFNTGNPLTESSIRTIIENFKKSDKRKTGQYTMKIGDANETVEASKEGLPASIPVVYYVMMSLFADLLKGLTRISDLRRLVNIANLIMMYAFCIHEGARPGDTSRELTHDNLVFHLGEEFPVLTLVFVKPQTLAYLLLNGHLKEYIISSWKGKDKKHYRGRYKSWFPPEYGMLCQVTLYIIMMRIILCLDSSSLTSLVFKSGNISDLRRRKNNLLGILYLTFYSIRYAAAEEDCVYNIPSNWINWRMGHSYKSHTRLRYAKNLDMRVTIDSVRTLLGCDVSDTPTDDNTIPLECRMFNGGVILNKEHIANIPTDIIEELKTIKHELRMYMTQGGSVERYSNLRIPSSISELLTDLKSIPLGGYFEFKNGLLTCKQQRNIEVDTNTILGFFQKVKTPQLIPSIWSYAQIMYGVWHNEFKQKVVENFNAIQAQDVIMKIKNMLAAAQGVEKVRGKTLQNMFKEGTVENEKIIKKRRHVPQEKKTKRSKIEKVDLEIDDTNAWQMMNIEVGNVVAIVCTETNDNTSMKVPSTNHYIWLCKVMSVEKLDNGEITAYMYEGDLFNLSLNTKNTQVIEFKETSIVSIFEDDDNEDFNLTHDNVEEIASFIKTRYFQ